MEYEIVVKSPDGAPVLTLASNERRHARALRELAAIPENKIAVEVMRTARRPVKFAGLDAPAPVVKPAVDGSDAASVTPSAKPAVKSVK